MEGGDPLGGTSGGDEDVIMRIDIHDEHPPHRHNLIAAANADGAAPRGGGGGVRGTAMKFFRTSGPSPGDDE